MSILGKLLSGVMGGVQMGASIMSKVEEQKGTLKKLVSSEQGIPVEEFLKMYDTRTYDYRSKQNDIKIMKSVDFEGVYILHNIKKDIYYVGKGSQVFRKIDRHFRGHGNSMVYEDFKKGHKFRIRAIRFQNSGYDNIDILERDVARDYDAYISGYNAKGKNP